MEPTTQPTPAAESTPSLLSADPATTHIDALLDAPVTEAPGELRTDGSKLKADIGVVADDVKKIVEDLFG